MTNIVQRSTARYTSGGLVRGRGELRPASKGVETRPAGPTTITVPVEESYDPHRRVSKQEPSVQSVSSVSPEESYDPHRRVSKPVQHILDLVW